MAAKELLLVLIHEVLNDKQATDVIDQSVLHRWVELDCVRVLAVVTERVVHLEHLYLALLHLWLLHSSHVSWCIVALFSAEDARLQVLLSVHLSLNANFFKR